MTFQDQLGRELSLPIHPPRRIVSLVPSQTELLYDLGLENEVVGITKFCVRPPEWFQTKARVGGTKTLNLEKIAALQPDLVIGNKEENERGQIEALARHYPVWISDVRNLSDAYHMMEGIGELTGRPHQARALVEKIRLAFSQILPPPPSPLYPSPSTFPPLPSTLHLLPSTLYLIWRKPYMAAGGDTFIHEMLGAAGFQNVFASESRYPEITLERLAATAPDVILLSSEPYPFAEKHFPPLQEACPQAKIRLVDGEMFSWYGSRLLQAPAYFQQLHSSFDIP